MSALSARYSARVILMAVGQYYTKDLLQKSFIKRLPIAREVLKHFKLLNALFEGFKGYETKNYRKIRNAVMFLCLPRIEGYLDEKSVKRLSMLEEALELFKVMSWDKGQLRNFKSRLTSEKYIDSLSAVTELEVALKMAERLGQQNVKLFPMLSSGRIADILVKVEQIPVYLEIGNLGESLPQCKIKDIIDASAKHLGMKVQDTSCYLQLIVDTARFVFDMKGRINVEASIKKLNSEIDLVALHALAGFQGFFDLDDIAYAVTNQSLLRGTKKWTQHSPLKKAMELLEKKEIQHWLTSFDYSNLKRIALIKGIIAGKASDLLVEIHTEQFFPSRAITAERNSYVNHIVRNVETQIDEQQLEPNAPNIIIIQGNHWTISEFHDLEIVYNRIMKFFDDKKDSFLSGIVVFGKDVEKDRYICNKHAKDSSKLDKKFISRMGFNWLENLC